MVIEVCLLVAGACLAAKTKAKAKVRKYQCIGPFSGEVYTVEEFPEHGTFFVVSTDKRTKLTYTRAHGSNRLVYLTGSGDPQQAAVMRQDLEGEAKQATTEGASS